MDKAKIRIGIWPVAIYTLTVTFLCTVLTPLIIGNNAPYWKELIASMAWGAVSGCFFLVAVKGYYRLKRKAA